MMFSFRNNKIAVYFTEESCPYTQKRTLNKKRVITLASALVVGFILYVLFCAKDPESLIPFFDTKQAVTHSKVVEEPSKNSSAYVTGFYDGSPSNYNSGGIGVPSRQRSANQVILRNGGSGDVGSRLPMGFGIPIKLVNAVHSSDSASPVIGEVRDDVFSVDGETLVIPASTRVLGSAAFNAQDRRLQMRFHTFVYPDGNQVSLQGLAMMIDGTAGLIGDYHSNATKRQVGKFLGTFVGGFAEGMKEKTASGTSGTPYEVGSLKNGVLNGVARSAEDQTKTISEDLSESKPYMTLTAGQNFVLYLEKEFSGVYQ